MRKELLKGLSKEQIEKASHCKSQAELLALAKEEGIELTDEQLNAVNGGICENLPSTKLSTCAQCGATATGEYIETTPGETKYHFICPSCGYDWIEK